MSEHEKILLEIEENERWLTQRLPLEVSSHEHLKLRTQVECQELWLTEGAGEIPDEPVLASLRLAVRQAVHEAARYRAHQAIQNQSRNWNRVWGVAVGLAAMIMLSIGVLRSISNKENLVASGVRSNLFAYDSQEEQFDSQLDDALSELDDLVAARDESEWNNVLEDM